MQLIISPRKLILALIYAPSKHGESESIEGITRMEKMMFLLTSEHFNTVFKELNYKGDNFGPFSDRLVDQIENLVDLKLIERTKSSSPDLADEFVYFSDAKIPDKFQLTKYGEVIAKKFFDELSDDDKKRIIGIKKRFNSIPLDSLLYFVYNNVPKEYLDNSRIKGKYVKTC